ncbi:MAG: hypothetical protein KatS3mg129_1983 [Leptospiraceae bacterium]|nr:MAG: hypothetical protein KatS3mg129_1983 [Leptospiraceae bacterium]
MNLLNKIVFIIFLFFISCIATEPFYIITQGQEQIKILLKKKKIDDFQIYNKYKEKIDKIKRIRNFAKEILKLNIDNHYKYLVEINRNAVSYIVIASDKLAFKPKSYWFPIVGRIYYIGFFDLKEAKEYADYLSKEFDVKISGVQAYSSLGWFSDPLFTFHLQYTEENLARLIFHELTHNTYWLKHDNKFNENLATFIENQGTILYLKQYYNEQKWKDFINTINEEQEVDKLFFSYKTKLNQVYNNKNLTMEQKMQKKIEYIKKLKEELKMLKVKFHYINLDYYINKNYNNADFVLLNLYIDPILQEKFNKILLLCNSDFLCFWKVLKSKFK